MKSTGIVIKLDELVRRTLDIDEKDPIEIFTEGRSVVLKKYEQDDVCCNCQKAHPKMIHAEHGNICPDCLDTFNAWA